MTGKIAYITAKSPFGAQETFILTEMFFIRERNAQIIIFPRDTSDELFHDLAGALSHHSERIPLFNITIANELMKCMLFKFPLFLSLVRDIAFNSRNVKIAIKNLAVLPKSLLLSKILKQASVSHLHAHWASTTATMAYIINIMTGISWSFTAHAWDIAEDNLLGSKCRSASFIRAISEDGRRDILNITNDDSLAEKITVIHMGVLLPEANSLTVRHSGEITMLCPANLVPKKGHKYLFEACRILLDRGMKIRCLVAGDGPLEKELKQLAETLNLNTCIKFLGRLSHEKVFDLYRTSEVEIVVLPSITTEMNEKEGIPVALMEAMSYGIPVVSTETAGIPELLSDGGGIMVQQRNSRALADAVELLVSDREGYNEMSRKGREKIRKDFNIDKVTERLLFLFRGNVRQSFERGRA